MTDEAFDDLLNALERCQFREDFEHLLIDTFEDCSPAQAQALREAGRLRKSKTPLVWRNPADYDRTDMTHADRVKDRLVCIALYGLCSNDDRDELMNLGYAYNGAAVLGMDADGLLEFFAQRSTEPAAKFLRDFINRAPEDKSLRAWALRVIQTPEGPWIEEIPSWEWK